MPYNTINPGHCGSEKSPNFLSHIMAFDPKWTVGWNMTDLHTVAQRNGYRVNVLKFNNNPTPLFTNWKALIKTSDGPFINVCIEQKGSLGVVSNIIPDSVMNNRETEGEEKKGWEKNEWDKEEGAGGGLDDEKERDGRMIFRQRFVRDLSNQTELYRIPQRRRKKNIRITIRNGQIVKEEEEEKNIGEA